LVWLEGAAAESDAAVSNTPGIKVENLIKRIKRNQVILVPVL
jgi:hypothetical protein